MNNRTTIVPSFVLLAVLRLCPTNGSKMFSIHQTFLKPIVQLLISPPQMPPDIIEFHLVALHLQRNACFFRARTRRDLWMEQWMNRGPKGATENNRYIPLVSYIP